MQIIANNRKQLEVAIEDICHRFDECESMAISYEKAYADKTKKQLGFFWGALISSIVEYQVEKGIVGSGYIERKKAEKQAKENFYSACSYLDDAFCETLTRFNGEEYKTPLRISEMDKDTMAKFIDTCIYLIDRSKCFDDLVLHPSIRYTWVRNVTKDDIYELSKLDYPRYCPEYLEHTRKQACIWCGVANRSEVHHLKLAGLTGTAYKADDWATLSLCTKCHTGTLHQNGVKAFEQDLSWITKYMSLVDFCRMRYRKWLIKL